MRFFSASHAYSRPVKDGHPCDLKDGRAARRVYLFCLRLLLVGYYAEGGVLRNNAMLYDTS